MIYLDVTDSCKSPINTGIQRVVRGFCRALRDARVPVTPMLWDPALGHYCKLSVREHKYLEAPFTARDGRKPLAEPTRAALPIPIVSKIIRQLTHRRNRLELASVLKDSDFIVVPQVFRDARANYVTETASRCRVRTAAFFYDAIPWRRPEITPSRNVPGVLDYMMSLAGFDLVITSSQEAKQDLRECWESNKAKKIPQIHVISWPLDPEFASSPLSNARPFAEPPQKILCLGTFEPRKNHLTLLAAAEILWSAGLEFELELIGRTTRGWGSRVLSEVERLRLAGRSVHWHRHVDNATVLAAFDRCAFTVFPSLMEGYGLPIAESLQRGKPCICGGNGALRELANGGGCLIVDQTNPRALADGMRQLLIDESLCRRLSSEARTRKFETWQEFVERFFRLIQTSPH